MTMRTNCFLLLTVLLGILPMSNTHANDSIPKSVILYTPYTKISVSPGASIDYSIDLINNTDKLVNANLSVSGLSSSWKHEMKSGGWNLSQLAVLPKEKKTFNLKVDVPLKVSRGSYHFVVSAGETQLPLNVVVAQQGTYQTEFTTDQPNMQGNSKSTFTFNATLKNQTADQQLYALMAKAPRGWNVIFKPNYKQATSAQVEANSSQNVSIDITPPANVEAGSYKIPVRAATGNTSAELELEVVVTGSYQMELTTPRGLLSSDVTAGDTKQIELEIKNTGSSLLKDIQLSANKPVDWDVAFEPSKIEMLKAGETATVVAILKASKKALPGDYVTTMMAKTPEVNADAQFRIAVKTPMIWGWVGVLIILATIGVVYYLFRKFVAEGSSEIPNRSYSPIDIPIIRYADVVLSLAECLNEQGNTTEAIEWVNKVRARAGVALLNSNTYTQVTGQDNMRERIRNERRWEFAGEGVNFFDEMRWKTLHESKFFEGAGLKQIWGTIQYSYSWAGDYIYNWAVPKSEIQMNENLKQNEGWID